MIKAKFYLHRSRKHFERYDRPLWTRLGLMATNDTYNRCLLNMAYGDILVVGRTTDLIYRYDGTSWDCQVSTCHRRKLNPRGFSRLILSNGDIIMTIGGSPGACIQVFKRSMGCIWYFWRIPSAEDSVPKSVSIDPENGNIIIHWGSYRSDSYTWYGRMELLGIQV